MSCTVPAQILYTVHVIYWGYFLYTGIITCPVLFLYRSCIQYISYTGDISCIQESSHVLHCSCTDSVDSTFHILGIFPVYRNHHMSCTVPVQILYTVHFIYWGYFLYTGILIIMSCTAPAQILYTVHVIYWGFPLCIPKCLNTTSAAVYTYNIETYKLHEAIASNKTHAPYIKNDTCRYNIRIMKS